MKQFFTILFILSFAVSGVKAQDTNKNANQTSLYERLGGTEGITVIVDKVVATHMENPNISARFLPYNDEPERLAVIKQHTVQFFSAGGGGDVAYEGTSMPQAHGGMNISPEEYMYVVDDIMLVLDEQNIDEESKKDVLAILWSLKGMIIGK